MTSQKRKSSQKKKYSDEENPPKKGKTSNEAATSSTRNESTAPPPATTVSVRSRQEQRKNVIDTQELARAEASRKGTTTTRKPVEYVIDPQVSKDVRWGLETTMKHLGHASEQLRNLLTLAQGDNCQLVINVDNSQVTGHGTTGVYVRDPHGKEEWVLLQEAFMLRPELLTSTQQFRVEVTASAGAKSPALDMSTTLLHELEIHAAPAGRLISDITKARTREQPLDLVLDFMRAADDHLSLDRQEQYIRTAARIFETAGQDYANWAADLFLSVSNDARNQFSAYAIEAENKEGLVEALEWLNDLTAAIMAETNAAAMPKKPRPVLFQTPGGPVGPSPAQNPTRSDALQHLAGEVSKRTDLLDVLESAGTTLALPVSAALDLYRDAVVPALLKRAPRDVNTLKQQMFFLTHHGVPPLVALEVLHPTSTTNTAATPPEDVEVKPSWPPEYPMFWLTPQEEKTWHHRDGIPDAMNTAKDLRHGAFVLIDGVRYRVAVSDQKRDDLPTSARPSYHSGMKKWVTLVPAR